MSEELSTGQWADIPEMDYWREEVKRRADAHLAEYPNAKRSMEIAAPEKAAQILYMLAKGDSWKSICDKTGVCRPELSRLERHHIGTLEKYRPRLAKKLTQISARLADIMERKIYQIEDSEEGLSKTSLKDIAISIGVVTDKASQLAGIATSVIEHRSGPTIEDAMKFRDEVRQRIADKARAEAIDV